MSKLFRGLRNAMGSMPKPAWVRCPGQRTFCCCITIRTGASIIGWFNFVSTHFKVCVDNAQSLF